MSINQNTEYKDDLTFAEIIVILTSVKNYLLKFSVFLLVIPLLGAVLGFAYAHFFRQVTFSSRLTFAVEEKSMGGSSSLAGLASQFGFDVGGGSGLFSSDNLVLLLRSKNIVESSLLTQKEELNGGHLLNEYLKVRYQDEIKDGDVVLFDPIKSRRLFTREEDSLLNLVVQQVQKKISVIRLDKKSSIISIEITDLNEQWALLMTNQLIDKAKELYLYLKTGKSIKTINLLEARVDSVKYELDKLMNEVAVDADKNNSLVRLSAKVPAAKKQMQVQLLSTLYGELIKNLEISKFTLEREEPVIQIIDSPSYPLKKNGQKRLTLAIMMGFIVFVLLVFYLLMRKYVSENITNSKEINLNTN